MGDRGNIILNYKENGKIYFYSHWTGSNLGEILKSALIRGKDRWDDDAYLSRIIFCEMIKDYVLDDTGFGISTSMGDGGNEIEVDLDKQTVDGISFEEFIK